MSGKRNVKNKHPAISQDFFALGGTSSIPAGPATSGLAKLPVKRNDSSFPAPNLAAKRPKLSSPMQSSSSSSVPSPIAPATISQTVIRSPSTSIGSKAGWEERALTVHPKDLKDKILDLDESDSEDKIERLLCGAAKQLREQKTKPDSCLVLTLLYLAKIRPLFFCTNTIVDAFSSLLKRDSLNNFMKNKNNLVPVLVVNLFHYAFHDENSWPENFIKMFIEDSLGDRVWVDNEDCKDFVDIIIASFRTKLPPKSMLQTSDVTSGSKLIESSALSSFGDDSMGDDVSCSNNPSNYSDHGKESTPRSTVSVTSRYSDNEEFVIRYVSELVNDHLNRRQNIGDVSRNMLKLLMATSGIRTVRLLVMQKLEPWFQNPKLSRPAQDLLLTICLNCTEADVEALNYLLKMRLKNKTFINHFVVCFKELLNKEDKTFDVVLHHVICNELSQIRNLNNLQLISIIFQQNPDRATIALAREFLAMIFNREDFLRALRALLREIVRQLRYEYINFPLFVEILLTESKARSEKVDFAQLDEEIRRRAPIMIVDLVTMTIFLTVNPSVREALSTSKIDRREIIHNFQFQISSIQCKAVDWLHETVITRYCTSSDNLRKTFINCLNKILLLDNLEQYCKIDNWPPENDRNFVQRVTAEVPLFESTLSTILTMGLAKDIPLSLAEANEISYALILRAAAIYCDPDLNYPVFFIKDYLAILEKLFECCTYVFHEKPVFPFEYTPPKFAVIEQYWRVWIQIFILAAHLPSTLGRYAWDTFPIFRLLIEMAVTNNYQYPPRSNDDFLNKELQASQIEKIKMVEFENYMAINSEINESNSYLINTLTILDPTSIPRRPTGAFLEDLKNKCLKFRLHQLLYQSRDPDFLLTIIDQQQNFNGSNTFLTPMNWLVELVESNENNFGMLPVQCLCEFLFGQIAEDLLTLTVPHETTKMEKMKRKEKRRKLIRLIAHFQNVIGQDSFENFNKVFLYLLHRLSSFQRVARTLAYKALYLIVSTNTDEYLSALDENNMVTLLVKECPDWLRTHLVRYLKTELHVQTVCNAMIDALDFETEPTLICEYFDFIAHCVKIPDEKLLFNCSSLLIHRKKIASYIFSYSTDMVLKIKFLNSVSRIFCLFAEHVILRKDFPHKKLTTDGVYVKFSNLSKPIPMSPYIVYGMILVLSFFEDAGIPPAENLSRLFFQDGSPKIFYDPEMTQPQPLLPEWLSLRLLGSNSNRLIGLILANINVEQLIKFLEYYGLSKNSLQKILQHLDKLNSVDSKSIRGMIFDRQNLLNTLQVHWMKGITFGHKFAKVHLNFKEDTTTEDSSMESISVSAPHRRKEEKFISNQKTDNFRKEDIQKIFKDKDVKNVQFLSRQISSELGDRNVKQKKFTKLFLNEFNSNIDKLVDPIVRGHFNSLFNVMIILVLKDSKHFGFNSDFQAIKKSLLSLKIPRTTIEETLFWNCFERFFGKDTEKRKKGKQVKKKNNNLKSPDDLVKFLRKFNFVCDKRMQNQAWCEIFKDLAVEKFYNKDTELEDSSALLQSVIFSRNRPYFLSLLLHKSNFSTLNHCIRYLLADSDDCDQLNPSAILDFLTICVDSPKLSIGREVETLKTVKHEEILQLDNAQIRKLIDFVVTENDIPKRVDLVLKSCCVRNSTTDFVVDLLRSYTDEDVEMIALELYIRLYLYMPNIDLPPKLHDEHFMLIQMEPSFMDKITHNLITSFMFVETNSQPINPQVFRSWELSILKIASRHPLLLIRQLPMIPSLLSGKVNLLNYEAFKSLNLLKIFHKLLNVLRLLRPFLWNKHASGLVGIFDLYIDFFMTYYHLPRQKGSNEELLPLLRKFLFLLDDWLKHDSDSASSWIKYHKPPLTELSIAFQSEQNLIKSIISGLPSQTQALMIQNCHNSLMKLRSNQFNQEKLAFTLLEASKQSNIVPEIAVHLLDEVRNFYMNSSLCEIAFNLSLKALQHNPGLSRSIISTYLRCFQTEISHVSKMALNFLPDFVILGQEYRFLILKKAFELAILENPNALPALNDSFKALKSQLGC